MKGQAEAEGEHVPARVGEICCGWLVVRGSRQKSPFAKFPGDVGRKTSSLWVKRRTNPCLELARCRCPQVVLSQQARVRLTEARPKLQGTREINTCFPRALGSQGYLT